VPCSIAIDVDVLGEGFMAELICYLRDRICLGKNWAKCQIKREIKRWQFFKHGIILARFGGVVC
jgi:hypothetical protein